MEYQQNRTGQEFTFMDLVFFKDQCRLLEGIINLLKVLCANKTSERCIIASLPHWYCNLGMIVINSWQCVLIDYYYYFSISFFPAAACSFKKTNRFLLFSPSAITENSVNIRSICSGRIVPPPTPSFWCHSNPAFFSLLSKSDPVVYNVKCWVVAARSDVSKLWQLYWPLKRTEVKQEIHIVPFEKRTCTKTDFKLAILQK